MSTKQKRKAQQRWVAEHGAQDRKKIFPEPPSVPSPPRKAVPVAKAPFVRRPAPPSISEMEMIELLSAELGVEVVVPSTATDARFVIDDLIHEERRRKRAL